MPNPKRIGSRRIWDRWALDIAFDALGETEHHRTANSWDDLLDPAPELVSAPAKRNVALEIDNALHGRDTTGMTTEQKTALRVERLEQWKEEVRRSPLDKRERMALPRLCELRTRQVRHGEIKGAGITTQERLEARGFVVLERTENRFHGWQITSAGVAAFLSGVANEDF